MHVLAHCVRAFTHPHGGQQAAAVIEKMASSVWQRRSRVGRAQQVQIIPASASNVSAPACVGVHTRTREHIRTRASSPAHDHMQSGTAQHAARSAARNAQCSTPQMR